MALVFTDLTKETTSTTGTGTLTLTGAVAKYQSFANIGTGNTTYYRIESGNDSEVGLGTYNGTLSRDTVYMSIIAGVAGTTKITVADGATVSCVYPAERAVYLDAVGNLGIGGASALNKLTVADTVLATGSAAGSLVDLSQTWNNAAGNPTAIKLNVTNSASGSTAKLMDLQADNVSQLSVSKNGILIVGKTDVFANNQGIGCQAINIGNGASVNTSFAGAQINIWSNNINTTSINNSGFNMRSTAVLTWGSGTSVGTPDLYLYRDAANTLAQRNSTNAQTFRLYNTYTSVSDYSRLTFTTNANNHQVASEAAGTGSIKPIVKSVYTSASDPTATDVPTGFSSIWKNSGTGLVKLWVNDGGTFKSVTLV